MSRSVRHGAVQRLGMAKGRAGGSHTVVGPRRAGVPGYWVVQVVVAMATTVVSWGSRSR
jgi:hypothetical protein